MPGVKGYKQADTHRLRVQRSLRRAAIKRLDERYAARHAELTGILAKIEADLRLAEVRERAAKAATVASEAQDESAVAS